MFKRIVLYSGLAVALLVVSAACGGAATPVTEPAVPAVEETEAPAPPVEAEAIEEVIHYANEVYAAALQELDTSYLEDSWHGEARRGWEETIEFYKAEGLYRQSEWQVEVTTVYFPDENAAIAKTIEFWDIEERDQASDELRFEESQGPLYETYHLEIVDGNWSIGRVEIFEQPSLTLTEIQGEVILRGEQVVEDQEVFQGDEIATGPDSSALLLYPFDSITEIRADGHLLLARLEVDPDQGAERRGFVEYELFGTSLWNKLLKVWRSIFSGGGSQAVDQPSEFGVSLEDDGSFVVEVQEGEVELTSAGQTVVVTTGQQSVALPGQPPSEPVPWPGPQPEGGLVSGIDLIVTRVEVTGEARVNKDGNIVVPLHVTVRNQGDTAAGAFKLSVDYTRSGGTFVAPFTVPGQADQWYPFADGLGPGEEVGFDGTLTLSGSVAGETVTLTPLADSCSGEEFVPEFCRVEESDESNNTNSTEFAVPIFIE